MGLLHNNVQKNLTDYNLYWQVVMLCPKREVKTDLLKLQTISSRTFKVEVTLSPVLVNNIR